MKKLFLTLLIVNCTLLIDSANAQWWVQGGNLLWPYGTVTVKDSFEVGKNALIKNNLSVYNDLNVGNTISAGALSIDNQINTPYIDATDGYFENVTVSGTLTANIETSNDTKVYIALLSQELYGDPEAFILENTLGFEITWTRNATGRYTATFSESIDEAKSLFVIAPAINKSSLDNNSYPISFLISTSSIQIRQDQEDIPGWVGATMIYNGTPYYPIKIIQYPTLRN